LQDAVASYYEQLQRQCEDYLLTGGPFPERLHLIALVGKFIEEHVAHLERWARWAEEQVATWSDVGSASTATAPLEVFHEILEAARDHQPRTAVLEAGS
jgi:phosphate uptake regulator